MKLPFDFAGKHVFVAGGTSGINLGIALAFASAGAKLSVLSRSADKVQAAVVTLTEAGAASAIGYSADVRQYDDIARSMQAAHAAHGELDVLISGAAGNFPAPMAGMSANAFKSVIDIDLLGTFNVMRSAFEYLRKPGASLINISAPQSLAAMPLQGHVCAAKAGVDMITRSLALEWGPMGIRVNSVIPGPIEGTEGLNRLASTDEALKAVVQTVPLKRLGSPADIANACLFLSSDYGNYVSGAILPVDGGWYLGGAGSAGQIIAAGLNWS
jgi:NAD(P)-dependent dehydrogenase (short-subunit alcohol dehydrogenase family)